MSIKLQDFWPTHQVLIVSNHLNSIISLILYFFFINKILYFINPHHFFLHQIHSKYYNLQECMPGLKVNSSSGGIFVLLTCRNWPGSIGQMATRFEVIGFYRVVWETQAKRANFEFENYEEGMGQPIGLSQASCQSIFSTSDPFLSVIFRWYK